MFPSEMHYLHGFSFEGLVLQHHQCVRVLSRQNVVHRCQTLTQLHVQPSVA